MSTKQHTTIKISRENWKQLNARKEEPGEAFNDVVNRLLEE